MKCTKYLSVIFLGTFIYVLLSLLVGQNSIKCYKQLEEQKRIVSKQKAEIQNINSELVMELNALNSDKAVIAAYARKLDYVADGEKLVKINGLKPAQTTLYDTGKVIRHEEPEFISERFCKICALIVSFVYFILLVVIDLKNGNFSFGKKKKNIIAGIPVYDIPQI